MGEAKQRKNEDPLFGRVPKERQEFGIVISPPITIDENRIHLEFCDMDPQLLRTWLLYWDKLAWPTNGIIDIETQSDLQYLIDTGILIRPEYRFSGDGAQAIVQSHIQALRDMESAAPGCWALAQGGKSLNVSTGNIQDSRDILISLHYAVPVPSHDIPYDEILEFKQRRLPELYRFRHEISSLYTSISNSSDRDFALRAGIERVQDSCADLIKVNKEWKFTSFLSSLDFSVSPIQWAGAAASFIGAQAFDMDTINTLFSGTIGAAITLTPSIGKRITKNRQNPYRYAFLTHKELNF